MKAICKDITGEVFGRWVVIKRCGSDQRGEATWLCQCACGTTSTVTGSSLRNGHSKSCGCLSRAVAAERERTHGYTGTREYRAWVSIKGRVCNPRNKNYPTYSLLGMDEDWKLSFQSFIEHIGSIPDDRPRWSVNRIDNDKGYFPGNVRWARDKEQSRNKGRQSNNQTGVTGVHVAEKRPGQLSVVAAWNDLSGKGVSRSFSVNKYGMELATQLAIEARDKAICLLNQQGAGYSDKHGK